jgi:hypothetical protein
MTNLNITTLKNELLVDVDNCIEKFLEIVFSNTKRCDRFFDVWTLYFPNKQSSIRSILCTILFSKINFEFDSKGIYIFENKLFFTPLEKFYPDEIQIIKFINTNKKFLFRFMDTYPSFKFMRVYTTRKDVNLPLSNRLYMCQQFIGYHLKFKTDPIHLYDECFNISNAKVEGENERFKDFFKLTILMLKMICINHNDNLPAIQDSNKDNCKMIADNNKSFVY